MRFALLAALALPTLAWAQPAETFYAYGEGNGSCAAWLSSAHSERIGGEWILGYWTGRNTAAADAGRNGSIGSTTDGHGIIGEVRLVCVAQPSTPLLSATDQVYRRMQQERR